MAAQTMTTPLVAQNVGSLVQRYAVYGPLVAAFVANLVGTFGDKGQVAVVTLASEKSWAGVFAGAMAAFAAWSALEVALGGWLVAAIPRSLLTVATAGLFAAFGAWTLWNAVERFRESEDGGADEASSSLLDRFDDRRGAVAGFALVAVAEFGDKTQLLTIALAAAFPDRPLSVFVGVMAAIALRTGVDAVVGEALGNRLPLRWVELAAGVAFVGLAALAVRAPL
ncbi:MULTISPECIES: TMEM165/GDT1 family protein [Halorussus]|uniref:TMEM165/GDT1 family protein n=1 Tax=Halorussus TaxID=1070314 RepID=UPI00209DC71D|nr:TMEM165/GDT1 family protein [Halorussus vallis]USZ75440.1 TMEM165/GDT1 family protein [Halorussus vallis]